MRLRTSLLSIAIALLFPFLAQAGEITLGIATGGDPTEIEDVVGTAGTTALEVHGSVGYQPNDNVRFEALYVYRPSQKLNRDDALVFVGYYIFDDTFGIRPFVGLGVGAALQGIDVEGGIGQASVGFAVPVTRSIDLTTTCSWRVTLRDFDNAGESCVVGATVAF